MQKQLSNEIRLFPRKVAFCLGPDPLFFSPDPLILPTLFLCTRSSLRSTSSLLSEKHAFITQRSLLSEIACNFTVLQRADSLASKLWQRSGKPFSFCPDPISVCLYLHCEAEGE